MLGGVAHARGEQSVLESAAAKLGDGGSSAEEGDAFVKHERAGRGGSAVELGEEAGALLARGKQDARLTDEIFKFRMFMGPALGADVAPESGFFWSDDADADVGRIERPRRVNDAIEHVAELDGAIASLAEKLECAGTGERTDLVQCGRAARGEEMLNLVESGGGELFEEAEAERLGGGRVDAVEDKRRPGDLSDYGTATGEEAGAGRGELRAGKGFGGLEAASQVEIGEEHAETILRRAYATTGRYRSAAIIKRMLTLASASPRRRELLAQAGYVFEVRPAHIPEDPREGEDPIAYVVRLAREKAEAVYRGLSVEGRGSIVVLGADTTVTIDGEILEKPVDGEDAARMLRRLSGRTHRVITGVAVATERGTEVAAEVTGVRFLTLSEEEIAAYVATGEPMDKAGAYAIQGCAGRWIPRVEGCYFNVVGLPLALVSAMLEAAGVAAAVGSRAI